MYLLLILFFGSLLVISFMIGRKVWMLQSGHIFHKDEAFLKNYLEELKHLAAKNIKKYGYAGLVTAIRLHIRSKKMASNKYQEIKIKINSMRSKKAKAGAEEKQEISKFLKIISEYKHKIREIKHKINEEEEK